MKGTAITDVTGQDLDLILQEGRPAQPFAALMPLFLLAVAIAAIAGLPAEGGWLEPLIPVALGILVIVSLRRAAKASQRQREEDDLLRQADEALRLARSEQAASALTRFLARPPMRPGARYQALIFLGGLLNRLGRHADAIKVCEHLLKQARFPQPIDLSIKAMRAFALLRENLLTDAYQAISELRRMAPEGFGAVTTLDLYHMIKTGHNQDALDLFQKRREQMAAQLSHRSSDGWALAAAAALALRQEQDARTYATNAAILGNVADICARFPECAPAMKLLQPSMGAAQ